MELLLWLILDLLLLSAIIPATLIFYSRRYSSSPVTLPYQVLMALISLWSLLYSLDILISSLSVKILVNELRFLVIPFIPVTIFWMFVVLADKKPWFTGWNRIALLAIPALACLLTITGPYHTLFRYHCSIDQTALMPIIQCEIGPWYILYVVYSYVVIIAAVIILIYYSIGSHATYRAQWIFLALLQIFGLALNTLPYTPYNPIPGINLAPVFFCIIGILYYVAIVRYGFLDLVPIARSRIIESMSSPVIVLNEGGKIVDVNPAAVSILGGTGVVAVGSSIYDITFGWEEFTRFCLSDTVRTTRIVKEDTQGIRTYAATLDLLQTSGGDQWRIIRLDDITAQISAEQAIFESESRFRQLANATVEGIIIHKNGIIVELNERAGDLFGYRRDELIGRPIISLAAPHVSEMIKEKTRIQDNNPYEAPGVRKDGTIFWGELQTRDFTSGTERLRITTIWDITKRHWDDECNLQISQLKQQLLGGGTLELKLRLITESLVTIFGVDFARIWTIGPGDRCTEGCIHASATEGQGVCTNQSSCLHLMVSSGRYTHVNGSHARVPFGAFKIGKIASGEDDFFITNNVAGDERIHNPAWAEETGLVSFSGFKLSSSDGNPVGVLAFFSKTPITQDKLHYIRDIADITSLVIQTGNAEIALLESEKKFVSIFRETPDAIIILNTDYSIQDVNRKFETLFGYSGDLVSAKKISEIEITLHRASLETMLSETLSTRGVCRQEITCITRAGVPFVAEIAISQVTIQRKPCMMIQIHDIDEIRRAYDAVAQANHKLSILSSITRHDILNLIMVTSTYSYYALEQVTDPLLIKQLNNIHQASEEIQRLIKFTGEYQNLGDTAPVWQCIDHILNLKTIRIMLTRVNLNSELNGVEIYVDRMLEKVIYNLVENSVRHGKNLTTITLRCEEQNQHLVIRYEDDGGGIPAPQKEEVFKRGFGKNTGMGLFLIREILSITGISIIENGEEGRGVRFEMTVPPGKWRNQDS